MKLWYGLTICPYNENKNEPLFCLIEIELTDLSKSGGAMAPPGTTPLVVKVEGWTLSEQILLLVNGILVPRVLFEF